MKGCIRAQARIIKQFPPGSETNCEFLKLLERVKQSMPDASKCTCRYASCIVEPYRAVEIVKEEL